METLLVERVLDWQGLKAMYDVKFEIQKSKEDDISNHLVCIDNDFFPKLSSILNLKSFAKKINDKTIRFEAWVGRQLIGLVSVYYNNFESKIGYVNHVGVLKRYRGLGISNTLISNAIQYGKEKGFEYLKLEVSKDNAVAKLLYEKHNFYIVIKGGNKVQMCKKFNNE
jgi:ribosomal protein S18 acetylase RimI-like enzyme